MNENWKDVAGYEGRYQVSDQGRVRGVTGKVLSPNRQNSGYHIVHLYLGGKATRKPALIHRLVAAAFVQGAGPDVNHKDGDKKHNAASNLEWATKSENMLHAHATGLATAPKKAVWGAPLAGGPTITFPDQRAVEIHFRGRATGVVSRCIAGKCGSAYGYVWNLV